MYTFEKLIISLDSGDVLFSVKCNIDGSDSDESPVKMRYRIIDLLNIFNKNNLTDYGCENVDSSMITSRIEFPL